jgi:ribosome-associated protein
MNKELLHESILKNTDMTFARSSGSGGQNVNKVNTKVHAFLKIDDLEGLSFEEKSLVKRRLQNDINSDDFLCIDVQDERFQERNRENALLRLEAKIVGAAYIAKKRRKTKPTKAAREKRLKLKRIRSEVKKNRSKEF